MQFEVTEETSFRTTCWHIFPCFWFFFFFSFSIFSRAQLWMEKCICSLLNIFHVVYTSTIDMVSGLILFSSLHLLFVSFPLCLRAIQLQVQLGTWSLAHIKFMACLMAMEFLGFLNCSSINAEGHLLRSALHSLTSASAWCHYFDLWLCSLLARYAQCRRSVSLPCKCNRWLAELIFSSFSNFEFYCSEQPTRMH